MDLGCLSTILAGHKRNPFININGSMETVGCNYANIRQLYLIKTSDYPLHCEPLRDNIWSSQFINIIDCNYEYPVFYESYYGKGVYYNNSNNYSIRNFIVLTNMGNIYVDCSNEQYYELGPYKENEIISVSRQMNYFYALTICNNNPQVYEDINIVSKLFVDVLSVFLKTKIGGKDNGDFKKLCTTYMKEINSYKDAIRQLRCSIDTEISELRNRIDELIDENVDLVNKNLILEETREVEPQQEHLSCCDNMHRLYTENIFLRDKIESLENQVCKLNTEIKLLSIKNLF